MAAAEEESERIVEAWHGGVAGFLKFQKTAVWDTLVSEGPSKVLLVLSPDQGELPVELEGAVGADAGHVNGLYKPTRQTVHGKTAYRSMRDPNLWLCYDALDDTWKVQTTEERSTNRGRLRSQKTELAHPVVPGAWEAWESRIGAWHVQEGASTWFHQKDALCATVGAAYEALLGLSTASSSGAGSATATAVAPVLQMPRDVFVSTHLAAWLEPKGLTEDVLLFSSDVQEVIQSSAVHRATTDAAIEAAKLAGAASAVPQASRVECITVRLDGPHPAAAEGCADVGRRHGWPGACACHSSMAAAKLLRRASELVPAERLPLFVTGPAAEDEMYLHVLAMLRAGLLDATGGLRPELKDLSWCTSDADVLAAIDAVLASGRGG